VKLVRSTVFESGHVESARRSIMNRRTEKRGANRQPPEVEARRDGCHAYLIRIAAESDQERALVAFRSVREPVHSVAEDEFLVAGEHLTALRKAGVPFEDLTESLVKNGKTPAE
jgi:hypothetical protein